MDNEVTKYIDKQKSPQKEICNALRNLLLKTFPGINEKMKLGVPWYEDKYYIVALKDHVNLGFSLKGLSRQEAAKLQGGGKIMKHVEIRSEKEINKAKLVSIMKLIASK